MGRHKIEVTEITPLPEAPGLPALAAQAEIARSADQIVLDQAEANQRIGALQAMGFLQKVTTVGMLKLFLEFKKDKKYKDLIFQFPKNSPRVGEIIQIQTIQEFCDHCLGRSYSGLMEQAQNFNLLGEDEDLFERAQSIGLKVSDWRAIRALPATDQASIIAAIDAGDKSAVLTTVAALTERVAVLEKTNEDQAANYTGLQEVLDEKNRKLDSLTKKKRGADFNDLQVLTKTINEEIAAVAGPTKVMLDTMCALPARISEVMGVNTGQKTDAANRAALNQLARTYSDAVGRTIEVAAALRAICRDFTEEHLNQPTALLPEDDELAGA